MADPGDRLILAGLVACPYCGEAVPADPTPRGLQVRAEAGSPILAGEVQFIAEHRCGPEHG